MSNVWHYPGLMYNLSENRCRVSVLVYKIKIPALKIMLYLHADISFEIVIKYTPMW